VRWSPSAATCVGRFGCTGRGFQRRSPEACRCRVASSQPAEVLDSDGQFVEVLGRRHAVEEMDDHGFAAVRTLVGGTQPKFTWENGRSGDVRARQDRNLLDDVVQPTCAVSEDDLNPAREIVRRPAQRRRPHDHITHRCRLPDPLARRRRAGRSPGGQPLEAAERSRRSGWRQWVCRGACRAQFPLNARALPSLDRCADAEDANVRGPTVDAASVVADLYPFAPSVDGGDEVEIDRPGHSSQDDVSDLQGGRVHWSDAYEVAAANQRNHGGSRRAELDRVAGGDAETHSLQDSHGG